MSTEVDIIDLKARSKEGRGLNAGEHWIEIQKNTFMNWVNLQLQGSGLSVTDFEKDFDNGVRLCALVEALQNRKIGRVIKKPLNQHQSLENVTIALRAIAEDNIRLVNIGSEDIVNGSQKLILGLVWHLILRYQIGKTKFPPKKLMLAWLQAVIPDCNIGNFSSDWNDGVALHALIEYCQPGLCPQWRQISRNNRLENCKNAMSLAQDQLSIPIVVRPEDFSSPHLDELSGMTYLSYYMMVDSPGYFATRREIRALLQQGSIENFTTDWNDGHLLCNLVKSVGGEVPGWPTLTRDSETNLQNGIDAARRLGIEPIFSAKEMADPEVEHLGIMAYAAYFRQFKPVKIKINSATMSGQFKDVYVKQEKHFVVNTEEGTSRDSIRPEVIGPDSIVPVRSSWNGNSCDCYFTPTETGQHKLNVYCDGENIPGCPVPFKVQSDRSKVTFDQLDRAIVGINHDLKVDTTSAGQGDIRIEATSPSGQVTNIPVMYRDGIHHANFIPSEVGDWHVSTIYDGEPVHGSPYTVKVFDPSLVHITDLHSGKVGQELAFHADASAAGEGEVTCEVFHNGSKVPCFLNKGEQGKYTVDFTPHGPGAYTVHAYMNKVQVRGSPYTVDIFDSSRVTVSGEGLSLVPVNTPALFNIHTNGAGAGKVDVDIIAPSGRPVPNHLQRLNTGSYRVDYVLQEVGEYTIEVKFANQEVGGSPFTTKAFDMRKLVVSEMPSYGTRNQPVCFNIDASQAGSGNIEIRVNEGRVPCNVENRGNHCFTASFTPENTRPHIVEMSFNDTPVIGSPWTIKIVDCSAITVRGKEKIPCHKKAAVVVHTNGQHLFQQDLDVFIIGPNDENVPYNLTSDSSGDTAIKYTPTHVGDYAIHVKYSDQDVSGSPFSAKAYSTGAIIVTPLQDGFVNQPMYFTIDVGDAGEGQLQIMVNNGNIPNEVEPEEIGKYRIKFIPAEVGRQQVDILFNENPLPCSPLTCYAQDISANLVGLANLIPVQTASTFHVQSQAHVSNLSPQIHITGPSGQNVPVRLQPLPDGKTVNVEYVPREIGGHTIRVSLAGTPIKGSPFHVKTFDPDRVRVTRVKQGIVGVSCKFNVDASEAGEGTLEISVTCNGHTIPNNALTVGKNCYECSFIGQQEGAYTVAVTYNDIHVQGSPFSVHVIDVGGIRLTGDNWNLVACNKKAGFNLVSPTGSFHDMTIRIIAPDGSNVPCRLNDRGDGTTKIDWHPSFIGAHKVYIDYAGVPIQGSPFSIKVFDSARVKISNINPGLVNRPVAFTLDASEAGDGNLEILIMCNNEIIPNYVQDQGNTKFKVTFTPRRAGPHLIHTQFNGQPVTGSPHECPVLDPESVQVTGKGVEMSAANVPTSFHVDLRNAGDAKLNVRVVSPFGEDVPVHVSGNAKSGLRIDYTPYEVGIYKVFVECAGVPVKGNPFNCNVYDPSHIRINAPSKAYFGKPLHFQLDTSAAGQGKLDFQVMCRGSEVPVRLREVAADRYDASFTPQNISPHMVTVFFNNLQVPGTPFEVLVIDSSSVSVAGDGVRLAKVFKESSLTLEHQGLDERDLDIRITAPSGNTVPARLHQHGNSLRINFTPLEVGPHQMYMEVGETPINGSPFICNVYDPSAVRITDVDKTAKKEREIAFTIDSSAAGAGTLEVQVTHKGQPVRSEYRKLAEGKYNYTFRPLNVGRYDVRATFNGDNIPGSPLIIEVEEDQPTFIRINFSSSEPMNAKGRNWFVLHMNGREVAQEMLDVMILAPNGENIPARLLQQPDGDYKVEWTPNKPGRHAIDVLFAGQQIQGSPFYIDVFDIHKIRVNNFYHGAINEKAGFRLDCSQAGEGTRDIRIQSPTGRTVPYEIDEVSPLDYAVSYNPIEVGQHKISITYSDMELNAQAVMESTDDTDGVLNELQAYLQQFSADDSEPEDGGECSGCVDRRLPATTSPLLNSAQVSLSPCKSAIKQDSEQTDLKLSPALARNSFSQPCTTAHAIDPCWSATTADTILSHGGTNKPGSLNNRPHVKVLVCHSPECGSNLSRVAASTRQDWAHGENIPVNSAAGLQVACTNPAYSQLPLNFVHTQGLGRAAGDVGQARDNTGFSTFSGGSNANTEDGGERRTTDGTGGVRKAMSGNVRREESNLGPVHPRPECSEFEGKPLKAQTLASGQAGQVDTKMGNKQSSPNGKHSHSDSITLDNGNFSFGYPSPHLTTSPSHASSTDSKDPSKQKKKKKQKQQQPPTYTASGADRDIAGDEEKKEDMYEINIEDEDDVFDNSSDLHSPAVPELIVDVLKADVSSVQTDTSSAASLGVALPADISTCNRAETTGDDPLDRPESTTLRPSNLSSEHNWPSQENESTSLSSTSPEQKWRCPDSGLHYPIIYRRSTKDPGSKQYKELVRELSSVLEKRNQATRSRSLREEKSGARLNLPPAHQGRTMSTSSENIQNVFANKSLLSKLENHLLNKTATNALINKQRTADETPDVLPVLRKRDTTSNSPSKETDENIEPLYALPTKRPTDTEYTAAIYALPNTAKIVDQGSTTAARTRDHHEEITSFQRRHSQEMHLSAANQISWHHHLQQQQHQHVLSWAHSSGVDGRKATAGADDVNSRNMKAHRPSSSVTIDTRPRSSDSLDSTAAHLTTIQISGAGLRRRSQIMYSEPDLTAAHPFTASTSDRPHSPSRQTIDPSSPFVDDHQQHYHHRPLYSKGFNQHYHSYDNLAVNSSFNTSRSFEPNQSYDISFGHETFDEEDGYYLDQTSYSISDRSLSSSSLQNPYLVKVNVLDKSGTDSIATSDTNGTETYFINTGDRPAPIIPCSSSAASIRTRPVSTMTATAQHSRNRFNDQWQDTLSNLTSPSWTSFRDLQEPRVRVLRAVSLKSPSSAASSPARMTGTLDHNLPQQQQQQHLYRKCSPGADVSCASGRSASGQASPRGIQDLSGSQMYLVIRTQGRVPDLIVDHQDSKATVKSQGSPFHQEIGEGLLPPAHGEGLYKGEEDKPATFMIDARGMKGEPSVQVDGPNAIAKCSIDPLPDGQYRVTYIPVEVGLFDVYVKWNGKEIPGSPFHPKIVDSRKVKVVGGWQHYMDGQERIHLLVGEEKKIPFDTSEAGPGQLRAEVKSPTAFIPVEVDDEHKGKSVVKFTPREEGNHYIHLYWSDHPLVNSPYLGYATSGVADPSKVWLTGRGLKEAVVREEAEFIIDGSHAGPGEPDVALTGVRAEIQLITTPLGGGKFRCTYIPVIPGAYLLNISWNGRQLRGAPYKVNVVGASYANRVVVNGEGLRGGLLGQSLDFRIDTRKAGPGELTAYCMGPSKVAYCELSDHHDGTYRLVVRPQETGRHVLQMKYGGEHVQGSPFPFKVSAQPDASKVRVSGPGVEHGLLANFQSQFIVETKGAGAGQLTVRIRGPKGAFQVEMYRESQKDRTILCRYYPSVTGLYIINVRWSGVDVPGSPFHVHILDTQQELEQVLHEQSFSGSGHHHLIQPSNSFHNTSIGSSNHHLRYASHQQNSHHQNFSQRTSGGYYQWKEGM